MMHDAHRDHSTLRAFRKSFSLLGHLDRMAEHTSQPDEYFSRPAPERLLCRLILPDSDEESTKRRDSVPESRTPSCSELGNNYHGCSCSSCTHPDQNSTIESAFTTPCQEVGIMQRMVWTSGRCVLGFIVIP